MCIRDRAGSAGLQRRECNGATAGLEPGRHRTVGVVLVLQPGPGAVLDDLVQGLVQRRQKCWVVMGNGECRGRRADLLCHQEDLATTVLGGLLADLSRGHPGLRGAGPVSYTHLTLPTI